MELAVISFTASGSRLSRAAIKALEKMGHICQGWTMEKFAGGAGDGQEMLRPLQCPVGKWAGEQFPRVDGILFIGAAGIAVRAISPYVKSKTSDPAVLVVDDQGKYVIPLLSGHLGGANQLARQLAQALGGELVITTATDLRGKFAVDEFAKRQGLAIMDMKLAKAVSADILEGRPVGFHSDFPVEGSLPEGLVEGEGWKHSLWVTWRDQVLPGQPFPGASQVLRLVPKMAALGIGCRKGVAADKLEAFALSVLKVGHIAPEAIGVIASIDLKKEEPGILELASKMGVGFRTFPVQRLLELEGGFASSGFVKGVTGVDNVCERAALAASGHPKRDGHMLVGKMAAGGVTAAVAAMEWRLRF